MAAQIQHTVGAQPTPLSPEAQSIRNAALLIPQTPPRNTRGTIPSASRTAASRQANPQLPPNLGFSGLSQSALKILDELAAKGYPMPTEISEEAI